ncbi:hypothetical protein AVEN_166270-1 [Araneus ventricosus]|uniref:Uncharacterized protein n=1 Tax=Araneus ventricosus TaxID=182803 RepID=A0A4Y2M716_ARAVE|nr:hypothetical protein AVEN_166270-1 [Araneus ventricosus]
MNFLPGDEVIGDPFQLFLFEVWRWLPHMPRRCIDTLRGIVKCRANSTTTAKIAVRQVKPFEVRRERSMLREDDNILSNPVSGTPSPTHRDSRVESGLEPAISPESETTIRASRAFKYRIL